MQDSDSVNYDQQCGVINDKNLPCSRSLACKIHTLEAKRAVQGRSTKYDYLACEWQYKNGRAITHRITNPPAPKVFNYCSVCRLSFTTRSLLLLHKDEECAPYDTYYPHLPTRPSSWLTPVRSGIM
ncbi:SCA7, zinc-binding domain-containing protein [Mycena leptocephala]|nr:SCA7, zinc-binding domain-containing protein [Mycena leptocephala]